MQRYYSVFISHAGPDKAALAIPLYERLRERNIPAFLDHEELHVGDNAPRVMEYAMNTAPVGVFILSPEFPARTWTMTELTCFQQREQEAIARGLPLPKLIPVFYRLTVRDCRDPSIFYRKNEFGESVFFESKFFDRVLQGNTTMHQVFEAVKLLSLRTGIENTSNATNENTREMHKRRTVLIDRIVDAVAETVQIALQCNAEDQAITCWRETERRSSSAGSFQQISSSQSSSTDLFTPHFEVWQNPRYVSLLMDEEKSAHLPVTSEARAKHSLLESDTDGAVLVLQGMPGVGKTCTMRALCHDSDIRARFVDGVYLISLGAESSAQTFVAGLCRAVRSSGGRQKANEIVSLGTVDAAVEGAMDWFRNRTCLFLLDDVWSNSSEGDKCLDWLSRVLMLGKCSALVLSTREKKLLMHKVVTCKVQLSSYEPRGPSSRRILLQSATDDAGAILSHSTNLVVCSLLDACSGLAVALAVTGRAIYRMALDMEEDFDRAFQAYYNFQAENGDSVLDRDADDYTSLSIALSTSLRILRKTTYDASSSHLHYSYDEMHRSLCVLQKQQWLPLTILCRLWKLRSAQEASFTLDKFSAVGLLDVQFNKCDEVDVKGLRLHDLVHDFALKEAIAAGEQERWHSRLLQSYDLPEDKGLESGDICRAWWTTKVTIDNFLQENIIRLLLGAGISQEAVVLVGRPQWILRQLQTCGIQLVERHFHMLRQGILANDVKVLHGDTAAGIPLLLNAIRMSYIAILDNPGEIYFQLCARLIQAKESSKFIRNVVEYLERHPSKPFLRPISLCLRPAENLNGCIIYCRKVRCVTVQEVEATLIAGTEYGRIQVFDFNTGENIRAWQAHLGEVNDLAVTKDKRLLVSRSCDKTIKVFDMTNDYSEVSVCRFGDEIWCMELTADSKWLVAGSSHFVSLWALDTGECVNRFLGWHQRWVTCLAISPDGKMVASGSLGGDIRCWELSTEEQYPVGDEENTWWITRTLRNMYGYMTKRSDTGSGTSEPSDGVNLGFLSQWVRMMCFTSDGKHLVSGSGDTIKLSKTETSAQTRDLFESPSSTYFLSMTEDADGQKILWAGKEGVARVHLLDGTLVRSVEYADKGEDIEFVQITHGGEKVIWCESDCIRIAEMAGLSERRSRLSKHDGAVTGMCMTPDGTRVVTGAMDCKVMIWDSQTGLQIGETLDGHARFVDNISLTPDSRKIVSVSRDKVLVWDLQSQTLIAAFDAHEGSIEVMKISLDGRMAITGSKDETVRVWDLIECNGRHRVLEDHRSAVRKIRLAQDGQRFVSLSETEGILWDMEKLERVKVVELEDMCFAATDVIETLLGVTLIPSAECRLGASILERDAYWKYLVWREGSRREILATMDAKAWRMCLSPLMKTLCIGLGSGHVSMLRVELEKDDEGLVLEE